MILRWSQSRLSLIRIRTNPMMGGMKVPDFGDDDPRDAWDDCDTKEERTRNLKRIVSELLKPDDRELTDWVKDKKEVIDGE